MGVLGTFLPPGTNTCKNGVLKEKVHAMKERRKMDEWKSNHVGCDHRKCLLSCLEPEWVWIELAYPVEARRVLGMLRGLLQNESQWYTAVMLLSWIWNGDIAITSRLLRNLHRNPENWPLIPYFPPKYRNPSKRDWGCRLLADLESKEMMPLYRSLSRCCVCKLP